MMKIPITASAKDSSGMMLFNSIGQGARNLGAGKTHIGFNAINTDHSSAPGGGSGSGPT